MTITARYSSRCPRCLETIQPGEQVEWTKGQPAEHADCTALDATALATAQAKAAADLTAAVAYLAKKSIDRTASDFEASLYAQFHAKGTLSEKQIAAALKNAAGPAATTDELLPAGRYAIELDGAWCFYRIWRGTRNPNIQMLYAVKGTEKGEKITGAEKTAAIAKIALDPGQAAIEFGHRTGYCAKCGKDLDVNLSRYMGIGPVCVKHWYGAGAAAKITDARAELRAAGLEPTASGDNLAGAKALAAGTADGGETAGEGDENLPAPDALDAYWQDLRDSHYAG